MKKNKLIDGHWYWIEYKTKKGYTGPGKYIKNEKRGIHKTFNGRELLEFYIPKYDRNYLYLTRDIKNECKPAPTYDELLKICNIKLEDYKYE